MKKIIITGKSGYVAKNLFDDLQLRGYSVEMVSVRSNDWKEMDFGQYDVCIHLAGLVHNNTPDATLQDYMTVNAILTKELAEKCKKEKVGQFIYFSTMAVYGEDGRINEPTVITEFSPLRPVTYYGISKLEGERYIQQLEDDTFKVAIVRPPMIYGKNAPGNFKRLIHYSMLSPINFNIKNERSAIYIETLTNYVAKLIDRSYSGIFHPQNNEYLSTKEVISHIRHIKNKPVITVPIPLPVIKLIRHINLFNKLYGNLVYSHDIDKYMVTSADEISFKESINLTVQ